MVTHATFTIRRAYPAAPERVFAAFSDPAKKRRCFAESKTSELLHYSTATSNPAFASPKVPWPVW